MDTSKNIMETCSISTSLTNLLIGFVKDHNLISDEELNKLHTSVLIILQSSSAGEWIKAWKDFNKNRDGEMPPLEINLEANSILVKATENAGISLDISKLELPDTFKLQVTPK